MGERRAVPPYGNRRSGRTLLVAPVRSSHLHVSELTTGRATCPITSRTLSGASANVPTCYGRQRADQRGEPKTSGIEPGSSSITRPSRLIRQHNPQGIEARARTRRSTIGRSRESRSALTTLHCPQHTRKVRATGLIWPEKPRSGRRQSLSHQVQERDRRLLKADAFLASGTVPPRLNGLMDGASSAWLPNISHSEPLACSGNNAAGLSL